MHVTVVHVSVIPDHVDDFIAATRRNHDQSTREQGNRRFDVLQSPQDPTAFLLYEAYASEADAKAHKDTPHYLEWRDRVAPWMAKPREGIPYVGLFPA